MTRRIAVGAVAVAAWAALSAVWIVTVSALLAVAEQFVGVDFADAWTGHATSRIMLGFAVVFPAAPALVAARLRKSRRADPPADETP